MVDGNTTTINWTYDALNRLITEDYNAPEAPNDFTHAYFYDLVGNRLEKHVDGGANTVYTYDANTDQLQSETTDGNSRTYSYDLNGSLYQAIRDTDVNNYYTYDYRNRMASATDDSTTVNYSYNPDGIRVKAEVTGGSATQYLIDQYNHTGYAQVLKEVVDNDANTVYVLGHDVLAQAKGANAPKYLIYDGHGSVRNLANSGGTITASYNYDASPGNAATKLLYAGEMHDSTAAQYYLRARWYSPATGRFNRMDPFPGNNHDPQSLHKYLYAHCNPINNIDPSGEQLGGGTYSLSEILIVSAIVGIMAGILTYNYTGSLKAALIVGASAFVLTFIVMGGIGVLYAAVTGGTVSSPHLLNPNTWQEAESMLGKVLKHPPNSVTYYLEGMTRGARPDCVNRASGYIAECKWVKELYMSDQLRNYAKLAKEWGCQLHIYVRANTHIGSKVMDLVNETGGAIIRIFEG